MRRLAAVEAAGAAVAGQERCPTLSANLFANFADDGEHSLVETNVYYTRLAEPIGKMWATNPRSPQGNTQCYQHVVRP